MRAVTNIGYCPQGVVRFLALELECLVWMGIREEMKQESESFRISLRFVVVGVEARTAFRKVSR